MKWKSSLVLVLISFLFNNYVVNAEQNKNSYAKARQSLGAKLENDFVIHVAIVDHPEEDASLQNVSNIVPHHLIIDFREKAKSLGINNEFNFFAFKQQLAATVEQELSQIDKRILCNKTITIDIPHMINMKKPKGGDATNKFYYLINTNNAYIFIVTPKDYALLIEDLTITVARVLKNKDITPVKINYVTAACGVDAINASIVAKSYKTQSTIGTLKIYDQVEFIEQSDVSLGDKVIAAVTSNTTYMRFLANNSITSNIIFCKAEHCYSRAPEDIATLTKKYKHLEVQEVLYNGVSNFLLGAFSLWNQEADYTGFVRSQLVKNVQQSKQKLTLTNPNKNITSNPTTDGSGVSNIKLENFAFKKHKIS